MEIAAIKAQLSITQVLQHYGLTADKHNKLCCPFHDDSTPSMQVYPVTNTYCCFSANCKAGTGDVIQFIELKESCSKHEALVKATSLVSSDNIKTVQATPALQAGQLFVEAEIMTKEIVLTKLFKYFSKGLPLTKKAVDYLGNRNIPYKLQELGFNAGDWHHKNNEKNFIANCVNYGLLKPKAAGGYSVWAANCVMFPLKNADDKIISLYGRSITNNENSRHFYLQNRSGLYPNYPNQNTTKLILTESIIDAISLLQQKEITNEYSILALYGTNGLTDEHQQAIINLPNIAEIILMLNADDAGAAATHKHAQTLQSLLPNIKITTTNLPAGEDVNSLLQSHDDPKILLNLIEARTETNILFSIENKILLEENIKLESENKPTLTEEQNENENQEPKQNHEQSQEPNQNKLNTQNGELLIFDTAALRIEVLGGVKIVGLDRMKVTLKVQCNTKMELPIRDTLDLYNRNQTEILIQTLTDNFDTNIQQTATLINELTNALDNYRVQKIEALQPREKQKRTLSIAEKEQALLELRKPNLLERTNQLIALTGIVGEEQNRLIVYLIYSVRKQQVPLHVMFLGSSGSGKTYLQEKISELIPEDDSIEITQITENALYYFKQDELKNKLLLIEDLDGAMAVLYPLRELQTKRKISKTVTLKDSKGNLKTITLTVEGPVCVSGCTTKEKVYEDNANRCFLLYTDQSTAQDKKINEYQTELAAGTINKTREQQYKHLFKNMQSLLQPINIINPYAKHIILPEQIFKPRRTMGLLLGFIEAITFYHQHQRAIKKDKENQPYIETNIADITAAFELLKDVLFSKSDELTNATRSFLERLKTQLTEADDISFTPQQIRKLFRLEPRTIQRYISELRQYGYIKQISQFKHRKGFEYSIVDAAEYKQLTTEISKHLENILTTIQATTQSTKLVTA